MSTISTKNSFSRESIRILSIDFETRQISDGNSTTRNQIFAAGFHSNTGIREAIHLEDERFNNDEIKFIRYIVYKIQSFQGVITGWYLTNSDLVVLDEVCKSIGVGSPVGFYEVLINDSKVDVDDEDAENMDYEDPLAKLYPYLKDKKVIDMYKVFHHNFIKNSVYPFMYRDLQLDTVATGMLGGYGKYISESIGTKITGENVLHFPVEEQKKYVLRDAELVIKLIERNNYEILNILRCIADITGLDFKQVCHAGVGKAWESIIYQTIQVGECERPPIAIKKRKYSGALVLKPEPKSYTIPIEIFDVKGLYPTVMMLHNLSFETVCCECCKDKSDAKVPQTIMDAINDGLKDKIKSAALFEAEKRKETYWICTRNNGVIPNTLLKFKEQREYHRNNGNEPMSQALKVMMNSIYGLFGSEGIFEFQDYRVAELVTAFAREKLLEMEGLANKFGMNIIYGDTDSIFVSGEDQNQRSVDSFIASCKQNLKVDVDHQNIFVKSILTGKKHYIGVQPDGKVIVKGMEGKKRDRPAFFRQVFGQLIDDYKNNEDVSINILKAFRQLEAAEVDPSLLAYSIILNKDPNDYRSYTPQHKIGTSLKKEAGEIIRYYKTGQQEDGYKDYSSNYQDLNIEVYKLELWNVVKEILRLLDYDIQGIEKEIFPDDEELKNDYVLPRNDKIVVRKKYSKNVRSNQNQQVNESISKYQLSTLIKQLC
jgi:DNA polymerase, archaea type